MKAARITQPTKALRADGGTPSTGKKYAFVTEYSDQDGKKLAILQDPEKPLNIVIIAREFVEILNEVIEFVRTDVQPAIERGRGLWQRISDWFKRTFGK